MRKGQVVGGRYRLEEQIGAGGMGVVWRAIDEELGRVVAVKRAVRPADPDSGRTHRQMRREARNAAELQHPHIVAFLDEMVDKRERWLVMEYLPAQSLAQILDRVGYLRPKQVIHIGTQIASALEAVHAKQIVHRDVKPGNILITADGVAKLTDFGVSRRIYGDVTVTDTGVIAGTVAFLAPEVAEGEEATPASDLFALGATLFAAVEGAPPFGTADNPLLVLRRAAAGDLLPVRRAGPLAPVLSALLQPDPAKRPDAAAARQMLRDLGGTSIDGTGTIGAGWPAGAWRRPRRSRRRAAVAAAGTCVAALAIGAVAVLPRLTDATVGDPRAADPCALIEPTVLARFGTSSLDTAHGNFDRCDVIVKSANGSQVDVKVELEPPDVETSDRAGTVQVVPQPKKGDNCVRRVLFSGQHQPTNQVKITAEMDPGPKSADLCAMAQTAATHAKTVLGRGAIPPRRVPLDTASLAWVNACELLDSGTLNRVFGASPSKPAIGFGRWKCGWESTSTSALRVTRVTVSFHRDKLTEQRGGQVTTIGGRETHYFPNNEEHGCDVEVVHRGDVAASGEPVKELMRIRVTGAEPVAQLCEPALELGAAAVAKLPSR